MATTKTMMDLTEQVILDAIEVLGRGRQLPWGDKTIDFSPPFARRTYDELFQEQTGVDPHDESAVTQLATRLEIPTAGRHIDVIKNEIFEEKVEDALEGPIFVIDYPASICPLTKRKVDRPAIAERFELFIQGMEIANAYTGIERPRSSRATVQNAASRAVGRRLDGQDGPRLYSSSATRDATGRRIRYWHRPPGHAIDQHTNDTGRDSVSAASSGIR